MTTSKKTTSKKPVAKPAKVEDNAIMTITQIATKAGRSPKVLRAIARNEHFRLSQGKARRLPEPAKPEDAKGERHAYYARDYDAFVKAIDLKA